MPKIFIFIDYYLPGHKFGGPIRTVSNLVSRLASQFQFFIFTSDRDMGDAGPYPQIEPDRWLQSSTALIYYTQDRSFRNILKQIREISPDLIYLNSFFSRGTIKVLIARKMNFLPDVPVLLAPRGEFAAGALAIKRLRKFLYIGLVNAIGLLKHVTLQASSEHERDDIQNHLTCSRSAPPRIAANLSDPNCQPVERIVKEPGILRVVFLSRISRNKNLDGAIRMLHGLQGRVELTICGPIGDADYWEECEQLIRQLPGNVAVNHMGDVPHAKVAEVLAKHHLMFLPSLGENFGQAIAESLAAGRPVLISDRTPWRNLESRDLGADIPLEQQERFHEFLQSFIDMKDDEFSRRSHSAREYAVQRASDPELLEQSLTLIHELIREHR